MKGWKKDWKIPNDVNNYDYVDSAKWGKIQKKQYLGKIEKVNGKYVFRLFICKVNLDTKFADKVMEIERFVENGKHYERHIYYYNCCGYSVKFPGDKLGSVYYGYNNKEEETDFFDTKGGTTLPGYITEDLTDYYSMKSDPTIYYLIKKIEILEGGLYNHEKITPVQLVKLIGLYREYPEVEFLISKGWIDLALDSRIYHLSKEKKRAVLNYIIQEDIKYPSLNPILSALKRHCDYDDYYKFQRYSFLGLTYEYAVACEKYDIHPEEMRDHLDLIKEIGELDNDYWYDWKHFNERHQMIQNKAENVKNMKDVDKQKLKDEKIKKILSGNVYSKTFESINGYEIYFPDNAKDIIEQANKLHQCLITCDYIGKYANGDTNLIFIKKNGKRIATAEVSDAKKLKQFYGNERNENDEFAPMNPKRAVRDTLNTFLKNLSITRKKHCEVAV